MIDAPLEEALRRSGAELGARSLPPRVRRRLLDQTGRRAGLGTARTMVAALVLANAVVAGFLVLSGVGRSAQPAAPPAAAPAAAAPARPAPSRGPLDDTLITGRRIVVDAWLDEVSACHLATATSLPPDARACRSAAVLLAGAAAGFAARLQALPPPYATTPGVADLVATLGNLQRSAQALESDIDRQALAAAVADDIALGTAAWSADMALVYGAG